nr:membrane protein insertion efficiency factor YidD [Pseudobythopirellula maris]
MLALLALLAAVGLYQRFVSPLLGPSCRFTPTCSQYCVQAVLRYGVLAGSWRAVRRVCRCHPWNTGGWDPP